MGEETELDDDLVEIVLAEALESLEGALWTLRAIDSGPQSPEVVASLFRQFHSIKGNTAMAGRKQISQFAHRMENALDVVRERRRPLFPAEAQYLIEAVDLLYPLVECGDQGGLESVGAALDQCLSALEERLAAEQNVPHSGPGASAAEQVMVPPATGAGLSPAHAQNGRDKLAPAIMDAQLPVPPGAIRMAISETPKAELQTNATPSTFAEAGSRTPDGSRSPDASGSAKLQIQAEAIVDAMTVAGELFQIDERLKFFVNSAVSHGDQVGERDAQRWGALTQLSREFDAVIEKLYEQLLDIQRVPVTQLTNPLERNLRGICRDTGKQIEFTVEGRDLRIDKSVTQALKDPLMHMVRNAADHGIETPEERVLTSKPELAKVVLRFEDRDDVVVVTLSDDGRGIDHERIREKIVEKSIVTRAEAAGLGKDELVQYIYHPGFSTASKVSELSGRGVGMDVVAKQIEASGGLIETQTTLSKGSTFILEIPKLGSPVVDGLAVGSQGNVFLIPLRNVLCFASRVELKIVTEPEGSVSALLNGKAYPLFHLPGAFEVTQLRLPRTIGVLVQDRKGNHGILVVDEVLGRRKALSQALEYEACVQERKADVAILGDGNVGFSIPVEELLDEKLSVRNPDHIRLTVVEATEEGLACAS